MVVKCLSVRKPWGYLIIYGSKKVENRTWGTKYRGPLYIHSSTKWDPRSLNPFHMFTRLQYQKIHKDAMQSIATMDDADVIGGVLLGCVDLVGCAKSAPDKRFNAEEFSMWGEAGKWHWFIENPRAFMKPIPVKGSLGIFKRDIPENMRYG